MTQLNVAVVGSRTFIDKNLLFVETDAILAKFKKKFTDLKVVIISGGASGADTFAEEYADARSYGKDIRRVTSEMWADITHPDARVVTKNGRTYDANAGHRRNTVVIKLSDIVIAFHNKSPGTANTLRKAKAAGKLTYEPVCPPSSFKHKN